MGEENFFCFFFLRNEFVLGCILIIISNVRINVILYSNLLFCLMCVVLINLESFGSIGLIM